MPITIDGTGTIGGLSAGGLPDLSVTTADLANDSITADKLSSDQTGAQPIYAARAWVNFNGTGTVAIRASGNVTSITDNAVGDYTVNFTTAMPDANYSVNSVIQRGDGAGMNTGLFSLYGAAANGYTPTASAVRVISSGSTGTAIDVPCYSVAIFR
jgi:hypothetical protein